MAGTPVMAWLVAVDHAVARVIWLREALRPSGGNRTAILKFTPVALVALGGVSRSRAVRARGVNGVQPLPAPPFSPYPWFADAAHGRRGVRRSACARAPPCARNAAADQVAEYREHWQESVHPMDIFRAIEITLAKHRFQEIPNRVYLNDVPELVAQGSQNKGEFDGRTVQEIQPQPIADRRGDVVMRIGIVAGQVLLLAAGIALFAVLMGLATIAACGLAQTLLAAVILWIAGRLIAQTSKLYVSEIEFESDLIVFAVTGTFSESRVATGMSVYDSTRSENTIVRSSLTPWLLVSRLHSSTLTVSGSANLEQPRLVLGMRDEPTSEPRSRRRRAGVPARPADHGERRVGGGPASGREHLSDERAHAREREARPSSRS